MRTTTCRPISIWLRRRHPEDTYLISLLCPPASGYRPQQSVSLFATQALACSSVRPVTPLIHRSWMSWAPSRGVPPQQGKLPPLARPHLYLRQQPRLRRRPLRNCRRWRRPCVPPCPITRYKDKTLGDMVAADPNALVWIATKFTGDAEVIAAAKLICDQALASA